MKTVEVAVKDGAENDVTIPYEMPTTLDELVEYYGEKAEELILAQVERMNTTDVRNGARTKLKKGAALDEVRGVYASFKPGGKVGAVRGDAMAQLVAKAKTLSPEQKAALAEQLKALLG